MEGEEEGKTSGLSLLPTQYFWDLPSGVLVLGTPKGKGKRKGTFGKNGFVTSSLSARQDVCGHSYLLDYWWGGARPSSKAIIHSLNKHLSIYGVPTMCKVIY